MAVSAGRLGRSPCCNNVAKQLFRDQDSTVWNQLYSARDRTDKDMAAPSGTLPAWDGHGGVRRLFGISAADIKRMLEETGLKISARTRLRELLNYSGTVAYHQAIGNGTISSPAMTRRSRQIDSFVREVNRLLPF